MSGVGGRPRVLHLFNVLGAATEQTWLAVAMGLRGRGWDVSAVCESWAGSAEAGGGAGGAVDGLAVEVRARVEGGSGGEVEAEMDRLAEAEPAGGLPDLVHGHLGTRVLHAAPYLVRGVPTVLSLYGYDASRLLRDPAWGARYRWAAARGARFVVLAEVLRERLMAEVGLAGESVRVVRLGVDLSDWAFTPEPGPTPARFVFVGRLTGKKGVGVLLEAAAALPRVEVELIGGGPLESELRARAEALGLGERLRWRGEMDRAEIRGRLRGATSLVLPSVMAADGDCEGTPIVLMEAQAAGLPVVTTRHAGNAEVVAPEARRWVVAEGDAAGLASVMSQVAGWSAAEREAVQAAGRAWVERRYDLRETVAGYAALYRELLGEAGFAGGVNRG